MSITRRTLLTGTAGTVALSTFPTSALAGVTNTILPAPIPQGGIGGQTEIHCTTPVVLASGMCVAIGGSFDALKLPNGTTVAASNAAIVRLADHRVMWAAKGVNGYVRQVAAINGVVYWGGTFTTFDWSSRDRLAAVTVDGRLTAWNPRLGSTVTSLQASSAGVYVGGSQVWAVEDARSGHTGRQLWKLTTTTGICRTLLLHAGALYAGGLFEKLGSHTTRLAKINPTSGVIDTRFNPAFLRPDDWRGKDVNGYDGDCVLSLAHYPNNRLLVGSGGGARNGYWVLDQNTGRLLTNTSWRFTPKSPDPASSVVPPSPYTGACRNTEGDCQAIAVVGDDILTGTHRGHVNSNRDWPTKRMLTSWSTVNGRVRTGFDPGFWGGNANLSHMNGGIQTLTYLPTQKVLVVGGCFLGTGDPYNNTGGTDIYGTAGAYRAALAYLRVA